MTVDYYVVECRASGCNVAAYVNDVCVGRRGEAHGKYMAGPFNELMIDGRNTIALTIWASSPPVEIANAYLRIAAYPRGAFAGGPQGRELLRLDWKGPVNDRGEHIICEFPGSVSASADLGDMFGRWAWQDAEVVSLDEAEEAGVLGLLHDLRSGLLAGDPEPFIEASRLRTEEMARAYPQQDLDADAKLFGSDLVGMSRQSWWGIEPIDPEAMDLRVCAEGRMVECVNRDWEAILRTRPNPQGHRTFYKVLLGKIDDQWRILR